MPRLSPGGANLVGIVEGGNQADVDDLSADDLSTALESLMVRAQLYGLDGSTIDRLRSSGNDSDGMTVETVGNLRSVVFGHAFNGSTWDRMRSEGNDRDGITPATLGVLEASGYGHLYNGATWDRMRGNEVKIGLASALRTASTATPTQTSVNGGRLLWVLNISAVTLASSPLINVGVRIQDALSGAVAGYVSTANFTPAVAAYSGICGAGVQTPASGSLGSGVKMLAGLMLPKTYDVLVTNVADITNLTYSLSLYEQW